MLGLSGGAPKAASRNSSRAVHELTALCHGLLSERGEVSGVLLATQAQQAYQSFDAPHRHAFFDVLVKEFSPDPDAVGRSGDAYRADPSAANLAELQRVVEPPRQELFRRLNMAPGGTRMLVDMRRDLLDELLHMIACKAAIKAGDYLAPEEITALLEQRHHYQDSHHCPHGRPTALVFTREELDRRFKRT